MRFTDKTQWVYLEDQITLFSSSKFFVFFRVFNILLSYKTSSHFNVVVMMSLPPNKSESQDVNGCQWMKDLKTQKTLSRGRIAGYLLSSLGSFLESS